MDMRVKFYDDDITIYDGDGTEVVHWVMGEWIEDPEIVFSIANAIHMMHTDPEELLAINDAHIKAARANCVRLFQPKFSVE